MAGRIVVGVDDSEDSQRALSLALKEALLRDAALVVVHAWEYPLARHGAPADLEEKGRQLVKAALTQAGADGVGAMTVVREGRAASVLVSEAQGADLLVVGSRGRGGVASAVLGSVSSECVHHAPCPVVVVRPERARATAGRA